MTTAKAAAERIAEVFDLEQPISPNGTKQEGHTEKLSQATNLVRIGEGSELWHAPDLEPFATITVGADVPKHKENWPIRSAAFKRYLTHRFYDQFQVAPNSQALQDSINVLMGKAMFEGEEYMVSTRLAEHAGKIYLDLANLDWEVVEITPSGWEVINGSPVKFRRTGGMQPLPTPKEGGDIQALKRFINIGDENDWVLVVSWLVAALRPVGPYPVLVLHGEQGSAKSTSERVLRALVDPNKAALRSEPKDERDLIIAATNGWCVALDNMSRLPRWLSDALCRLATGGGFGARKLYENDEEALFDAQRPVLLNGIEELAVRGDLLQRAIVIYLPTIPDGNRRSEKEFWELFELARPSILGAVLDGVSSALKDYGRDPLETLPRMADFAMWSVAAAPVLGWNKPRFIEAYDGNRDSANGLTLEASPVVPPLRQLLDADPRMDITATELLTRLNGLVVESVAKRRSWPKDGRALSNQLRTLAANLRADGIDLDFDSARTSGRRGIIIKKLGT